MTRAQNRCTAALLLLVLVAAPLASAATPFALGGQEHPKGLPFVWKEEISNLWSCLVKLWEKEGSSLDPDGRPRGTQERIPPSENVEDGGSSVDPSGHV